MCDSCIYILGNSCLSNEGLTKEGFNEGLRT